MGTAVSQVPGMGVLSPFRAQTELVYRIFAGAFPDQVTCFPTFTYG